MVVSKQTVLLGTSGLINSNNLLLYNSNTFLNPSINKALGLEKFEIDKLLEEPSRTNIGEIYSILTKHEEYSPIPKNPDSSTFTFDNLKINSIDGQGFNVIIFLFNNDVLGFTELLDVQGFNYVENNDLVELRRNYSIRYITIFLDAKQNEIRIDEDSIRLFDDLTDDVPERELPYLKKKSGILWKDYDLSRNYINSLLNIFSYGKQRDLKLGYGYINFSEPTNPTFGLLGIKKNITFSKSYSVFSKIQFGYFDGDISIFLWSDEGEYSILSMTEFLNDMFEEEDLGNILKSYTLPKSDKNGNVISQSDIYQIPNLNYSKPKIEYFSGRYIVCSIDGTRYLFDILSQSGKDTTPNTGWVIRSYEPTGRLLGYERVEGGEWKKIKPFETEKIYDSLNLVPDNINKVVVKETLPIYETDFILDQIDPFNKVVRFSVSEWQTYKEAVTDYPEISEVYANSESLVMNGNRLIKKVGSWLIFYNPYNSILTYTNQTKSIKFVENEENPIVVNDQVIIGRNKGTYVIYNEDGYFISSSAKEYLSIKTGKDKILDDESFDTEYIEYTPELYPSKFSTITSLLDFRRDFWKYYCKNILPETTEGLEIIGAFRGLIFYRLGNIINYL